MRVQLIVRVDAEVSTEPLESVALEIPGDWLVCECEGQVFAIVAPDVSVIQRQPKDKP